MIRYLITAYFLLCTSTAYSQIHLKLHHRSYTIPHFSDDTLSLKDRSVFDTDPSIKHLFIQPIKQSDYAFEARCFFITGMSANGFQMIVIKGNKDSLIAEKYIGFIGIPIIKSFTKSFALGDGKYHLSILLTKYHLNPQTDSTITKFIELGMFNRKDARVIYNELVNNNVKLKQHNSLDCCGGFVVDIKLGNRYHSFTYDYNPLEGNPDIKVLQDGAAIQAVFRNAVN